MDPQVVSQETTTDLCRGFMWYSRLHILARWWWSSEVEVWSLILFKDHERYWKCRSFQDLSSSVYMTCIDLLLYSATWLKRILRVQIIYFFRFPIIFLYMTTILQSIELWLYTMWFINILVWGYAVYAIYRVCKFIVKNWRTLWEQWKMNDLRIIQSFSSLVVLLMLLFADIWAMSYYVAHTLAPLEFFYYTFDAAVVHHILMELYRMEIASSK